MNEREKLPPIPVGGVSLLGQPPVPQLQIDLAADINVDPQTASLIRQRIPQVIAGLQRQINGLRQQNGMLQQIVSQHVYRMSVIDECFILAGFTNEEFKKARETVDARIKERTEAAVAAAH